MKVFWLLYSFLCVYSNLFAQNIELDSLLTLVRVRCNALKYGELTVEGKYKTLTKKDTLSLSGSYFFWDKSERGMSNIYYQSPEKCFLYGGKRNAFYMNNTDSIISVFDSIEIKRGIKSALTPALFCEPFLRGDVGYWTKDLAYKNRRIAGKEVIRGQDCYKISWDEAQNQVLDEADNAIRTLFFNWYIDDSSMLPVRIELCVVAGLNIQYYFTDVMSFKDTLFKFHDNVYDLVPATYRTIDQSFNVNQFHPLLNKDCSKLPFVSEYKPKSRYILLEFWNTSCGPCVNAMKVLGNISKQYSTEDIQVIAVPFKDTNSKASIKKWLQEHKITCDIVYLSAEDISKYRVVFAPTLFLIDRQTNTILYVKEGWNTNSEEKLLSLLKNLIH